MNQLKKIFLVLFVALVGMTAMQQEANAKSEYSHTTVSYFVGDGYDVTAVDCWYYDTETGDWSGFTLYYGTVNGRRVIWVEKLVSMDTYECNVMVQNNELLVSLPIDAAAFLYELGSGKLLKGNVSLTRNQSNSIQLDNKPIPLFLQIISEGQIVYQQSFININNSYQLISGGK